MFLLAKEFFIADLQAECATFPVTVDRFSRSLDQISSLAERVSELERRLSHFSTPPVLFQEAILSEERQVENLRLVLDETVAGR
jgi:hypothetical protein